jgi:hypothetical protein
VNDDLQTFLESLFHKSPFCLMLFAAMVFAIARVERHRVVSLLAAAGFGWLLLMVVAEAAWRAFLVPDIFPEPPPPTSLGESLSYVVFSALQSLGFIGVVVALFLGRPPRRHPFQSDPADEFDDLRRG